MWARESHEPCMHGIHGMSATVTLPLLMLYTYGVLRRHGLYSRDSWPQTLKVSVSVCMYTNTNEINLEAVHTISILHGLCNILVCSSVSLLLFQYLLF